MFLLSIFNVYLLLKQNVILLQRNVYKLMPVFLLKIIFETLALDMLKIIKSLQLVQKLLDVNSNTET